MFSAIIIAFTALLVCTASSQNSSTIIIPNVTGPHGVIYHEFESVDNFRTDPFNSSHSRRLMISRYTPIPKAECDLTTMPYAPAEVTSIFWAQFGNVSVPKPDLLLPICVSTCSGTSPSQSPLMNKTFPIAIFSPGYASPRYAYHRVIMQLASQGFEIYSLDHTYETDPVVFPNGDVIRGLRLELPNPTNNFSTTGMEYGQKIRVDDISYLLSTLGFNHSESKALALGHSFGGASALAALAADKRVRAAVNLDGNLYAPTMSTPLGSSTSNQAFMLFGSDHTPHWSTYDPAWQELWNTTRTKGKGVDYAREVNINDTLHVSYGDMSVIFEMVGFPESYKQLLPEKGLTSSIRVHEIVGRYVSEFFWWAVGEKEKAAILVDKESKEFPEVWVVNDKIDATT